MKTFDKFLVVVMIVMLIVVAIKFSSVFTGNVPTSQDNPATTSLRQNSEATLSGKIVPMDPNRAMAGAPCHFMAGEFMGDCDIREIEFEAWQYSWSEPTITVKSGELIRIIGTSRDVTHGIAIPKINFNMILTPGETSIGEFMAPPPGSYSYGCSVACGPGHHGHSGKLVVI